VNKGSSVARNPNSVIPMVPINDPAMFASVPSADADQLAMNTPKPSPGGLDGRLVPLESTPSRQEQDHRNRPVATPTTPGFDTQTPTQAQAAHGTPSTPREQQQQQQPLEASPVKCPEPPFDVEGRDTSDGDYRVITLPTSSSNKKCEVWDLHVHNAHGSIEFPGLTDLAKVNIHEAIRCHHLRLELYPDAEELPAEGEGLNKPAVIKLYNMDPKKNDKKVDPEKFERMLQRSLGSQGSEHKSYQEEIVPGGGKGWVWTFAVRNCNRAM